MTESELRTFFEAYGASFAQTEREIAPFYHAPCLTARQGVVRLHATGPEVAAFFGAVLEQYRAQGITQGGMRHFACVPQGAHAAAATITWAYQDAAGHVVWEWTFTYTVYLGAEGWRILVQTMHDGA